MAGDHDYRRHLPPRLQYTKHAQPIGAGHSYVEQNTADIVRKRRSKKFIAALKGLGGIVGTVQQSCRRLTHGVIIIYN